MANGYFVDNNWQINTEGRGRPINSLLVLALIPILGLMFVVFLPVIGFYLVGRAVGSKIVGASIGFFDPTPVGEMHLTGHGPSKNSEEIPPLKELSKEIEIRRQ
jgi:small-conductance mechanosensitive channel